MKKKTKQLLKRTPVNNTPFVIVSNTETNEHFGTIGDLRITKIFNNKKEATEKTIEMTWDRIIQVIDIIYKFKNEQR